MTTEQIDGEGQASVTPAPASVDLDLIRRGLPQQTVRTLLGTVTGVLHLDTATVVHGTVASGMVVGAWCRVQVHGRVEGPVSLGRGAVLRVRGEFSGDVVGGAGLVVVSGQVSLEAARTGRVVFERGSLLVGSHGEGWWVEDDGSIVRTDAERHVEVTGTHELIVFDPATDRFGSAVGAVRAGVGTLVAD